MITLIFNSSGTYNKYDEIIVSKFASAKEHFAKKDHRRHVNENIITKPCFHKLILISVFSLFARINKCLYEEFRDVTLAFVCYVVRIV